jgi:hypothetical protein
MLDIILDIFPPLSDLLNLFSARIYGFWTAVPNNLLMVSIQELLPTFMGFWTAVRNNLLLISIQELHLM